MRVSRVIISIIRGLKNLDALLRRTSNQRRCYSEQSKNLVPKYFDQVIEVEDVKKTDATITRKKKECT